MSKHVWIFTDGSFKNNVGGAGAMLTEKPSARTIVSELSKTLAPTSTQSWGAELKAASLGIQRAIDLKYTKATIVSDQKAVLEYGRGNWKKKQNPEGNAYIDSIAEAKKVMGLRFVWTKGHMPEAMRTDEITEALAWGNDYVDSLAGSAASKTAPPVVAPLAVPVAPSVVAPVTLTEKAHAKEQKRHDAWTVIMEDGISKVKGMPGYSEDTKHSMLMTHLLSEINNRTKVDPRFQEVIASLIAVQSVKSGAMICAGKGCSKVISAKYPRTAKCSCGERNKVS